MLLRLKGNIKFGACCLARAEIDTILLINSQMGFFNLACLHECDYTESSMITY